MVPLDDAADPFTPRYLARRIAVSEACFFFMTVAVTGLMTGFGSLAPGWVITAAAYAAPLLGMAALARKLQLTGRQRALVVAIAYAAMLGLNLARIPGRAVEYGLQTLVAAYPGMIEPAVAAVAGLVLIPGLLLPRGESPRLREWVIVVAALVLTLAALAATQSGELWHWLPWGGSVLLDHAIAVWYAAVWLLSAGAVRTVVAWSAHRTSAST